MATLVEFSNEKLKKLTLINRFLLIGIWVWLAILLIDGLLVGRTTGEVQSIKPMVFWLFPITLYSVVFIAFYGSHGVLESRNYKPLLWFLCIQLIGFLCYSNLTIEVPVFFIHNRMIGIAIVAGILTGVFVLLFHLRRDKVSERLIAELGELPLDESIAKLKDQTYGRSFSSLGNLVSIIFSILIVTLVNVRLKNDDAQYIVSYGSLLGLIFIGIIAHREQTILALLSLLDPNEAKYLYILKSIKDKAQFEISKLSDASDAHKMDAEMISKQTELEKDVYRASLETLIREMERKKNKAVYEVIKAEFEERIRRFETMTPREKVLFLTSFEKDLKKLRETNLPEFEQTLINYENLTINEKIMALVGLTAEEIIEAINLDLINPTQKHIWTAQGQYKIKTSMSEISNEEYDGQGNIFITKSVHGDFATSHPVFTKALDEMNSGVKLVPIKGLERMHLEEFRVLTAAREYSVVIGGGPKGEYLVHAIIPIG